MTEKGRIAFVWGDRAGCQVCLGEGERLFTVINQQLNLSAPSLRLNVNDLTGNLTIG